MMIRQLSTAFLIFCVAVFNSGDAAVADAPKPQMDIPCNYDHPAQRLDAYLAKSVQPTAAIVYIHGGGW